MKILLPWFHFLHLHLLSDSFLSLTYDLSKYYFPVQPLQDLFLHLQHYPSCFLYSDFHHNMKELIPELPHPSRKFPIDKLLCRPLPELPEGPYLLHILRFCLLSFSFHLCSYSFRDHTFCLLSHFYYIYRVSRMLQNIPYYLIFCNIHQRKICIQDFFPVFSLFCQFITSILRKTKPMSFSFTQKTYLFSIPIPVTKDSASTIFSSAIRLTTYPLSSLSTILNSTGSCCFAM